jgi:hypothetical protein
MNVLVGNLQIFVISYCLSQASFSSLVYSLWVRPEPTRDTFYNVGPRMLSKSGGSKEPPASPANIR